MDDPELAAPHAPELAAAHTTALLEVLGQAHILGFLGPGPTIGHLQRSLAFAVFAAPGHAVDLGTGGGVPGLVLAMRWAVSRWLFVESSQRRAEWLRSAVATLGLSSRCQVAAARAETVGRGTNRAQADLVTARSFGLPAATAECAAPLLRVGGALLVADPPSGGRDRWPEGALRRLGLELRTSFRVTSLAGPVSLSCLVAVSACPEDFPRRDGSPFKKPLF